MKTDLQTINEILTRWIVDINIKKSLEAKLQSWKQLRVKFGIDPSWFDLTLWHAVPLRKLKQFQDAGHQVILLIWSFTAQIGDPTWKSQVRKALTKEQVLENAKDYINQAGKILDVSKLEVVYNWDWLEPMSFADVLRLASNYTVQQMLHRDMYQERMKKDQDINLVEFLYPLMQWYDSVPLKADIEIWWNDQLFNLMAWRKIQEAYGQKPQDIITVPILVWLDWKEKMSKSLWNYIAINDSAKDMFGKTMSIPDDVILNYFELATEVSMDEIEQIKIELESWTNPRNIKVRLAKEIVTLFYWKSEAEISEGEFNKIFQWWWKPDDIEKKQIDMNLISVVEIISELGLVSSKWEAKRMIEQWGIKINDKKVWSIGETVKLESWMVFQAGKRKWAEIE